MQRQGDGYFLIASNPAAALRPSGGGTCSGSVTYLTGPTSNPVCIWTHEALTYDGTTLRLYINGVLAISQARTGTILAGGTNPLWIGGNSPHGEYSQGLIDEVRIYNRALSQTEIQSDMNTPLRSLTKLLCGASLMGRRGARSVRSCKVRQSEIGFQARGAL
jgi:Concanavalin A-like lectin/glucanases superfamily